MLLAIENPDNTADREWLAGSPLQSQTTNGWLIDEKDTHERRQVTHEGVGWQDVICADLGNAAYEYQGYHWRSFASYEAAKKFARLGVQNTRKEGVAVFFIPLTSGLYQRIAIADAVVKGTVAQVVGVSVKVAWTVRGAYPADGAEVALIEGARTTEEGVIRTTEDGDIRTEEAGT